MGNIDNSAMAGNIMKMNTFKLIANIIKLMSVYSGSLHPHPYMSSAETKCEHHFPLQYITA